MVEERVKRRLAAVLAADVVGYSRLMGADEIGTLTALKQLREELTDPTIVEHGGRIVKLMGDGVLVEFSSVVDAVECAISIQKEMAKRQNGPTSNTKIVLRIGVNLGDVIIDGDDIYGEGVNVAARLESLATPGGICLSLAARDQVRDRLDIGLEDMGEVEVKNIARPVRCFAVRFDDGNEGLHQDTKSQNPVHSLPDKPSIAVLPFDNLSGDPEQDYFADGMVEDIITALSQLDQLFVIARNSTFTYKGRSVDIRQVSSNLGVRYVLEGSVRKAGNRLRITGQLIEGATGTHLWANHFDGRLADVFDLQDRITESVVGAIVPSLRKAEIERSRKKHPENLVAYDLYLRALPHVFANRSDHNTRALELLLQAIELDQDYTPALSYAAWCYEQRLTREWETAQENDRSACIEFAHRAIDTDSDDSNAMATAGFVLLKVAKDYDRGLSAIERALTQNPNNALICDFAGWARTLAGEPEAALVCFQRAERLSPGDPNAYTFLAGIATAHLLLEQPEEALNFATRSVAMNSEWDISLHALAGAAAQLDRIKDAQAAVERLLQIAPNANISLYRKHLAMRHEEHLNIILEGLRMGGLPE